MYQTAVGIVGPVEIANEALHLQKVIGQAWPHELPVIIDIYLYERIHASCLSYFSNRPFGIEQILN